jgi:hypothetical protein
MSTKMIVAAGTPPRPAPFARDGRDPQYMNAIPRMSASSTKISKMRSAGTICLQFSGSVNPSRSFAKVDYWTLLFRSHR